MKYRYFVNNRDGQIWQASFPRALHFSSWPQLSILSNVGLGMRISKEYTFTSRALTLTGSDEPALLRAGVIGDIHCEDQVLELVLQHFSRMRTDSVLAVGDIVDGVGDVNRVCALLAEHGVLAVAGNHDRWLLEGSMRELPNATAASTLRSEARFWLEQLPKTRSLQTPRGSMLLCHGFGDNDMATVWPEDEGYALQANFALRELIESRQHRFVVCGHSHKPMVRSIQSLIIINAGTLDRRDRQVCSIIDFALGNAEFFDASRGVITSAERFALS